KQKFLIAGDNNLSEIVKTEKLKVTIAGDGKFIGSGEAKNVTIRVVGDGVCDLSNIKTYSANIKIIGDGIVIINTHKLKAKMIGDGTIRTIRNPTFTKNFIIGDGRVIANNDDL
ncbi:MAG: GIN domain-containing protein, partial [Flavobacteriaceae bacterium]